MSRFFKSAAFPILIVVVLAFFAQKLISPGNQQEGTRPTGSSSRRSMTARSRRSRSRPRTTASTSSSRTTQASTRPPILNDTEQNLLNQLRAANVRRSTCKPKGGSGWLTALTYILPFVIFLLFWLFIINQMQGGGSKVMSFGKSRAKRMSVDAPKITFDDVAGVDDAIEELLEVKEYLTEPERFPELGGRISKGVLLNGPPGTGKTLLARAVAGEAGCRSSRSRAASSFRCLSAWGRARPRPFESAKDVAPAIIFIDEIDAVGRQRGAGLGGGHDEREQR